MDRNKKLESLRLKEKWTPVDYFRQGPVTATTFFNMHGRYKTVVEHYGVVATNTYAAADPEKFMPSVRDLQLGRDLAIHLQNELMLLPSD